MNNNDMCIYNIDKILNRNDYCEFVSIGNKCLSRIALENNKMTTHSFPFDYVPTTPALVLRYLCNQKDFLPKDVCVDRNADGVWFGHFDLSQNSRSTLEETFSRRFKRLFDLFASGRKFCLLYTTEADVYNEMNNHIDKCVNYIFIRDIVGMIKRTFPNASFDVVAIHTNDIRMHETIDGVNIYNYTVLVSNKHISLNMETHVESTIKPYRDIVTELVGKIFQ